jgi:hypothetical protein
VVCERTFPGTLVFCVLDNTIRNSIMF